MSEKIALITGGTKGLGKTIATALLARGYYIFVGARDVSKAPEGTFGIELDLSKEDSILNCINQIINKKGKIDLLINNAGMAYWGSADSMTVEEVRNLFEVNVFGTFRLTQLVIPHMREKEFGRIVFVSSIRGVESCAFMGVYSASKAALESIAFDWAATLAKWNILVSVVQPGPLNSGIEIKHGTYFKEDKNPYSPYPEISLEYQDVNEAANAIISHIFESNPPFRFQTSSAARNVICKHLHDPSGNDSLNEQRIFLSHIPHPAPQGENQS